MNSMQRIQATLEGRPVDRRVFAPILSLYGARLTGCPLQVYYSDPAAYASGQAAVYEKFCPDMLCAPLAFAFLGEAFGSTIAMSREKAPQLRRGAIGSSQEWDRLSMPDVEGHPRLVFLREAIRRLAAEHAGRVPIVAAIPALVDIPELIMGMEAWLETVLFDDVSTRRVMDSLAPFYVRLVNDWFAAGASFIAMPCALASPAVASRRVVREFVRPMMMEILPQIRGPVILHNAGARQIANLDLLVGLPSVVGFLVDHRDDLAEVRKVAGPKVVVFGGLDCTNVARMSAQAVEAVCSRILEERRDDPRFVLATSGPDVPGSTPPENILAMRAAVESAGGSGS